MKKLIILPLFTIIFLLSSCTKEPVVVDVVQCTDNQTEVAGECIDLTGQEIQLRSVIENTKEITNYQLAVSITENDVTFQIVMKYDDNVAVIQTLNQEDYYVNNEGTCEHFTVINDVIISEQVTCFTDNTYLFFKDFEYTWFTLNSGMYFLNEEHYPLIEEFFANEFVGSSLVSFKMTTTADYITEMRVELLIDEVIYEIEMVISEIDQIDIEIPGEE